MAGRQTLPTPSAAPAAPIVDEKNRDQPEQKIAAKPEYKYFKELTESEWLDLEKRYPSMTRQQMEERAASQEWYYWIRYGLYVGANLTNVPYAFFRADTSGAALETALPLFSADMKMPKRDADIVGGTFASIGTAGYVVFFSAEQEAAKSTLPDWFYNRALTSLQDLTTNPLSTLTDALDLAILGVTFATVGFSGSTPSVIATYFQDRPIGKWLNALGNQVLMGVYNEIYLSHRKGREFWTSPGLWLYERMREGDFLRVLEVGTQSACTIVEYAITYGLLAQDGSKVLGLGSFGINPWVAGTLGSINTIMTKVPSSYKYTFGADNQLRSILAAQVDAELKAEISEENPATEPLRRKKRIDEKLTALQKDVLPNLQREHAVLVLNNEGYLYSLKLRPTDLISVAVRGGIGFYLGASNLGPLILKGSRVANVSAGSAAGLALAAALHVAQRETLHDQMLLDHVQRTGGAQEPQQDEALQIGRIAKLIAGSLCLANGFSGVIGNTGAFVLLIGADSPIGVFLIAAASVATATNLIFFTYGPVAQTVQSNVNSVQRLLCAPKRPLGPQVVMREGHESLEPGFVTVDAQQHPASIELADLKAPVGPAAMYQPARTASPPPAVKGRLGDAVLQDEHFTAPARKT